jgi:glycosyltransferase involved in cell wall biosynthesis
VQWSGYGQHVPSSSCSVVIRALNEADHLPALFSGLLRQSVQPNQVVLVDSGSTDDSVAIAEAHGAEIVHIKPAEFSFGRSLNVGCDAATEEILVFVSAHVYPMDADWLKNLLAPFADADTVLSYGRQTGDHRTRFSEMQLMRQWYPDISNPDQMTPFCNNANCAIRRSWWERFPYDEQLTGLEDLAWATNALREGGHIAYRADAVVAHIHDENFHQVRNRYRREALAHRRIFDDQRLGALETLALFFANVGRDYIAALPRGLLLRNLGDIINFRAAQYLGTWEGFRTKGEVTTDLKRHFYYPKGFSFRSPSQDSRVS